MQEALEATLPVIDILESLQVPYFIGGSLASSFHVERHPRGDPPAG